MTVDHGSDEVGAFAHDSSIDELPFCDLGVDTEASLRPREVVPLVVGPEVLAARKSDDEALRESQG